MGRVGRWIATSAAAIAVVAGAVWAIVPPVANAADAQISWTAVLTDEGGDNAAARSVGEWTISDVNQLRNDLLGEASATVLSKPHATGTPVTAVRAEVDAGIPSTSRVETELRGLRPDGQWTEWRTAAPGGVPTALPAAVTSVQARLTLVTVLGGQSPVLRSVRLTVTRDGAAPRAQSAQRAEQAPLAAAAALTYRVFATREGLVGHSTANGHVITANDHFVALPSRRGLSPKNTTTYSVRVCNPANGRCLTAPVWDVGPWNTKDDYWNPSSQRQMWNDLPQGRPEAQAAYQNGYHGGKDEFGRTVLNPAGIDLADGVFADLGMGTNGFVNVTYLWTGTSTGTWPTVRRGATGVTVRALQYLLNHHGAGLVVDGDFGSGTEAAVRAFQSSHGMSADGVVGPQTWGSLVVTVSRGANNNAVRAAQTLLNKHGNALVVDGNFGSGTDAAVRAFQTAAQITADGVVGPQTWQRLLS